MPRTTRRRLTAVAVVSSLTTLALTGSVIAVTGIGAPRPAEVRFNIAPPEQAPDPFIASGVAVGNQVPLYFSSGTGPGALNTTAPAGTPERYIDPAQFPGGVLPAGVTVTQAQGMNAMARVRENLASQGLSLSDVISMRIYLEAPPSAARADYDGWNRAYRKWMANVNRVTGEVIPAYAPVEFANATRPSRTNLEVGTLPVSGWLIEIEVVAAYPR